MRSMLKQTIHAVVAVLLWVVFVYYWTIVFRQPMNPDTKTALVTLGVLTCLSALCLIAWVVHNVLVRRRVGERRRRRRNSPEPTRDYLGRRIIMENAERLRRSNHIEVEVARSPFHEVLVEHKIFRTVDWE